MTWVNLDPADIKVDEVGVDEHLEVLAENCLAMRESVFFLNLGSASTTSTGSYVSILAFYLYVPDGGGSPTRQLHVEVHGDLQAGVTEGGFRLYDVGSATAGTPVLLDADGYADLELDLDAGWVDTFRRIAIQARVTGGAGTLAGAVEHSLAHRVAW